jgi:hypothetical protein
MADLKGYEGQACDRCGGTRWKRLAMPVFRVEECLTCHANRTTTDLGAGIERVPVSVVYVVTEYWGILRAIGEIVGVFNSQAAAEREAERRTAAADRPPHIQYQVNSYEVLG